jgi:acyl-coenzyme A synthetase/AMP-(fatty) acid ligase
MALHEAAVNRFAWMWRRWPFTPSDVGCQKTSLSFVDSVWEIFGPLLQGVPSVIVPDEMVGDPPRLVELLAAHRVTRIVLVPSMLARLLDALPDLARRVPDLTFWITSGEAISGELARRFEALVPLATLVNLYGSSEVAADVSAYVISGGGARERIPIGRPIANTRLYVLDAHANPVPIGVPGEIHVGGVALARGYLHDAELTARKFVRDPFAPDAGARLYRTGDLGRLLPDGNLEYLGRTDTQVKLRGVRIELGEVESVLRAHPSIQDAVALVSGADGDARLVAYVVPGGRRPEPNELRRFARERLPITPSRRVHLPGRAADDAQRQARSACAPGVDAHPGRRRARLRRSPHGHRGHAGRHPGRGAQGRPGRHPRRFLRARWSLAPRGAGDRAGPQDPACRAAHAEPVHRADGGRPRW